MFSTCVNALHSTMNNKENFANTNKADVSYGLTTLIMLILWVLIILLVGQFLWNNVLIELFPFVNKIKSVWQLYGLMILLALIIPK